MSSWKEKLLKRARSSEIDWNNERKRSIAGKSSCRIFQRTCGSTGKIDRTKHQQTKRSFGLTY